MVEPFAVGLQAASKARIAPGDLGVVIGAGAIGIMVALAALAGGCSRVIISYLQPQKLAIAGRYPGVVTVDITRTELADVVARQSDGWGADVVFEASGSPKAYDGIFSLPRPGGCLVVVGMPSRLASTSSGRRRRRSGSRRSSVTPMSMTGRSP